MRDVLRNDKDTTVMNYIHALEKAEYIVQTSPSIYPKEREYMLILDTGALPPIFRTSRKGLPALVKDRNIDRTVDITGRHVECRNALLEKIQQFVKEQGKIDYDSIKERFFKDVTMPKGYNYTLLDYYIKILYDLDLKLMGEEGTK